jgi:hypothetical protein
MEYIKNYEGLYKVDTQGNVYSCDRYNIDKNGKRKFYPGKLLTPETFSSSTTEYKRVTLSKNGITKRFLVHRLVAETYIPNSENKPFVNHIDNNGSNNCVENLEWCTHSENMKHAHNQGRLSESYKKANDAKLLKHLKERHEKCDNALGNTYNNWKVVEILNKDTVGTKVKVIAECQLCDTNYELGLNEILNGSSTNCNPCGNKKNTENRINALIGTYVGELKVLRFHSRRNSDNKIFLEAQCSCGNISKYLLSNLHKNKISKCKSCR